MGNFHHSRSFLTISSFVARQQPILTARSAVSVTSSLFTHPQATSPASDCKKRVRWPSSPLECDRSERLCAMGAVAFIDCTHESFLMEYFALFASWGSF